jgi:5-methylcytosine-specific restriction endonuclease McrA
MAKAKGKAGRRRATRLKLLALDPHCRYCGCRLGEEYSTLDHVLPLSKGGQDTPANYALACKPCNSKKGDFDSMEEAEAWLAGKEKRRQARLARRRARKAEMGQRLELALEGMYEAP